MRRDIPQRQRPVSRTIANWDKSPARVKVFAFILSQPTFPEHEAICDHMGWRNLASVSGVLTFIYGAGYVHRVWDGKKFVYIVAPAGKKDFEAWQRETQGKAA